MALTEANAKLQPISKTDFAGQLGACLSLVVPTGMSTEERTEWLRAAWITLEGIPADLLAQGCGVARRFCDHPSKVVPTILREVDSIWQKRKSNRSAVNAAISKMSDPEDNEPRCTPEEAEQIRKALNIRYPEDGSTKSADYIPVEKRTGPDREWYLAHGIDPNTLEQGSVAA